MNIAQIRYLVKEVYSRSAGWQIKVDKMSDDQVYAIYRRFKAQGKIK